MSSRFHIARTPHQYGGMRWSVMEKNGNICLMEVCRCPTMAEASLVCDAMNHAAKDRELWSKMCGRAAASHTKWMARHSARTVITSSDRTKARPHGNGSAADTSVSPIADTSRVPDGIATSRT